MINVEGIIVVTGTAKSLMYVVNCCSFGVCIYEESLQLYLKV